MKHSLRLTDVTRYTSVSLKPRSNYVCHQCRQLAFVSARRARTSPPVYIQRRFASGDNSWTDNLRRRLWGTDNPPGQEDPYSQPTIRDEEKMHERAAAEAEEATNRKASMEKVLKGDYQKSLTWDDLDQIGGQDESWKEAWDENHPFEGFVLQESGLVKSAESQFYSFMAPTKMESREEISEAIHRALVEVFTLKEARVRMEICMGYGETSEAHYIKHVSFEQAANGTTIPIFAYEQLREVVLDSLTEVENDVENDSATDIGASADESQAPVREETELIEDDQAFQAETGETVMLEERSNDVTWLNVSFHDSKTKFAIIKRVMQLTGTRIPDPSINDINSAKALFGFLVKKPKPKKLAQSLMADENLINLPNVKIMDRRYTPIDKEKQVGRWKVIEKELTRQGLPVTGGA